MSFDYSLDGGATWATHPDVFPVLGPGVLPTTYMPAILGTGELVRMHLTPTPGHTIHPSGAMGDPGNFYPAWACRGIPMPFGILVGVAPEYVAWGEPYPYGAVWGSDGDKPALFHKHENAPIPCVSDLLPQDHPEIGNEVDVVNRHGDVAALDLVAAQAFSFYISAGETPPRPVFWTALNGVSEQP